MKDLNRFMRLVGARGSDVARETGLSEATISRLRKCAPGERDYSTVRRVCEWADREARRRRIKRQLWLDPDLSSTQSGAA